MSAPQPVSKAKKWTYVSLMLVTGSINTVVKKIQNGVISEGRCLNEYGGMSKQFNSPWWQTGIMFLGESVDLGVYNIMLQVLKKRAEKKKLAQESTQLLNKDDATTEESKEGQGNAKVETQQQPAPAVKPPMPLYKFLVLGIVLCTCDLLATSLQGIGLLWVVASVYQLLRGAVIIFTSLFSLIFLKRHIFAYQWAGIIIAFLGLACVGVSGFFNSEDDSVSAGQLIAGILLILFSQIFSATQFIIEEKFMKGAGLHPLKVVGIEGLIGAVLMEGIVLPYMYAVPGNTCGSYENFLDAWTMFANDGLLCGMVLLYWISIAAFNYFSLSISKFLTSVHRTLFDSCRTILVWVCQVIIYYAGAVNEHGVRYGESITGWSALELAGFGLLILGTVTHNNVANFGKKFMFAFKIYTKEKAFGEQQVAVEPPKVEELPGSENDSSSGSAKSSTLSEKTSN